MACATRRQVSIVLKGFGENGWISAGYGKIVILDAKAIRDFAQVE